MSAVLSQALWFNLLSTLFISHLCLNRTSEPFFKKHFKVLYKVCVIQITVPLCPLLSIWTIHAARKNKRQKRQEKNIYIDFMWDKKTDRYYISPLIVIFFILNFAYSADRVEIRYQHIKKKTTYKPYKF